MSKPWEPIWNARAGTWQVDFSIEGERFRKRLAVRDIGLKAIARRRAEQYYRETWARRLDPVAQPAGTPFFLAVKGFVDAGHSARFLDKLLVYFGPETMIEDLDEPTLAQAEVEIYPNAQPATRRRQVRTPVNAVLNWHNGTRRKPSSDRVRTRWLTPEEAERLITAAAALTLPRHATPESYTLAKIAFLLGSGCRTGECFAAEVKDWNPTTRQWWIAGELQGAGKTAGAARMVRLPQRAVDLIGNLPEVGRAFRTPYGKPIILRDHGGGQMQTAFNRARDAAGLGPDVTPHVLRHTWATWFYAQTKDFGGLMDQADGQRPTQPTATESWRRMTWANGLPLTVGHLDHKLTTTK